MQIPARLAAAIVALVSTTAPAAAEDACANSLARSEKFKAAMEAVLSVPGVETYEFRPIGRPPQPLEFLDLAEKAGFEGTVIVMLVIAPDGAIVDRVITCAAPFGYFEPEVLDWAKDFKFGPLPPDMPVHHRRYIITAQFRFHYDAAGKRTR